MSENCLEEDIVQFSPLSSFIDPGFWHKLTQIKLDVDRLNETQPDIWGNYNYRDDVPPIFEVDGTSFNSNPQTPPYSVTVFGKMINKNTMEDFKSLDKAELLNTQGELLKETLIKKEWIKSPNCLMRFFVLSFANLKKYYYYYWFAFPAPAHPVVYYKERAQVLRDILTEKQMHALYQGYRSLEKSQKSFFVIVLKGENLSVKALSDVFDPTKENEKNLKYDIEQTYFAFADPSNNFNPGWPLRNFIAALLCHCPLLEGMNIRVVSLRSKMNGDINSSLFFRIHLPLGSKSPLNSGWVGWERNEQGKLGCKVANMAASMDPTRLADTSADLNLKLMKWRLVPDLDLDIIKKTKCLLLGAGTLGCNVARSLLAWGFRDFTFVDSGKVAYSNPVRQSLFTHEDTLDGGRMKATAAAENLKIILPSVSAIGLTVQIPMPGHPVGESLKNETMIAIHTITQAIQENDLIFLLLDSREARWMPTVIAAFHGKMVINAALGFDSYLVMRHGNGRYVTKHSDEEIKRPYVQGFDLGCYFCNDVTAPGNSQKDRTLDQQCTVTRPGVSAIAAALAVEVAVGLLQHKRGLNAPAIYNMENMNEAELHENVQGVLGPIPHSIRGFISSYQQILPTCTKFKQCVACSNHIMKAYEQEQMKFLLKVIDNANYLEEVTGLIDLHLAAEMTDVLDFSDAGSDD